MPEDHFAGEAAERYDSSLAEMADPAVVEPTVDFLLAHVGSGSALELGVGTGRIALPLHQRGVPVKGIDLSTAMTRKLREKPGGDAIGVTIGDFATTVVDGTFTLAYLVFNTIMNLTTQDEQVACFCNVARHLEPGGVFVVEVMVPELQRLPHGESIRPGAITATTVSVDEYDVVSQGLISHHYLVADRQLELRSIPFRYVWPAELDLMARIAGMTLTERWADWTRAPFTADSTTHVSVWTKTGSTDP